MTRNLTSGRRRIGLAVALVVTAGLAVAASALAYEPPSVEELRDQLARRQVMVAADPPRGDVLRLDGTPDATGTAVAIHEAFLRLEELEKDARDLRPNQLRKIAQAKEATLEAFESYGLSPDIGVVFRHLREAALNLHTAALPKSTHGETIQQISTDLTLAGQAIAENMVERARSAGVGEDHLRRLANGLEEGENALQAQHYVVALGQFGGTASFVSNELLSFDIDLFEQNIRDALDGNTVGYAYTIGLSGERYINGVADFGGVARTSADDETDQSPTKEMYIASITKTISAVALLIALDEAGISVDDNISPYLPESWTQGENVDSITFRLLMTHQSGLNDAGNQTLAELEQVIATGTDGLLGFSGAQYTNSNFSLLRILIPQVVIGQDVIDVYTNVLPADEVYAGLYEDYVSANVLTPAGISAPNCGPRESVDTRTLYYLFTDPPSTPGLNLGDWWKSCGATGYYLSAVELGSLMAHLRYTDDIIDDEIRDQMDSGFLGWLNPKTFADLVVSEVVVDEEEVEGDWGVYRAHGGDSSSTPVQGMSSCMMKYPIEVEAVVLVNSRGNDVDDHVCTVLRDAYDGAWVAN